jgi:hypothetical protein
MIGQASVHEDTEFSTENPRIAVECRRKDFLVINYNILAKIFGHRKTTELGQKSGGPRSKTA